MTIRLVLASILLAAGLVGTTNAQAAIKHAVDIRAQGLGPALAALAQQTGIQLIYPADLVAGIRANAVSGSMTPEEALRHLLSETKLKFEFLDVRTVTLSAKESSTSKITDLLPALERGAYLALSQVDSPAERRAGAKPGDAPASSEESGTSEELPAPDETSKGIPELLVRGSKILNADVRRTEDDPQPYVVFTADDMARSLATNVEDFLKTRLPMNSVQRTNVQVPGTTAGNNSAIDLRGLGIDQTLVLVNGRRMASVTLRTGDFGQPNLNGIPLGAIERIEILPSTASGIYGGGATGGVINVILKSNYTGVEARGLYENSFDSDAARRQIETTVGFDLEGGRTNVTLGASYADQNKMVMHDRDFQQRGRDLFLSHYTDPLNEIYSGFPPNARTSNIVTFEPDLVLDNGTSLGSRFAHVPAGYQGPTAAGDGGLGLVAGPTFAIPDDLTYGKASLVSAPQVWSLRLNLRRDFSENLTLFADAFHDRTRAEFDSASVGVGFYFLPADAVTNPFMNDIFIVAPDIAVGGGETGNVGTGWGETESTRAEVGGILRLPHDWSMQSGYGWSRSRSQGLHGSSPVISAEGQAALGSGQIDLLRDFNEYPVDLSQYFLPWPNSVGGPYVTELETISLRAGGPTFRLPGGPINVSALVEYRREEAMDSWATQLTGQVDSQGVAQQVHRFNPNRRQSVYGAYAEAVVPLVDTNAAKPGLRMLDLQISARHDRYRTNSVRNASLQVDERGQRVEVERASNEVSSTDYTVALRYSPIADFILRASYGTGFLAPGLTQITPAVIVNPEFPPFHLDPLRGNQFDPSPNLVVRMSGNPDIQPELSKSWSAGIILRPGFLPGLRLSADYTRIDKTDEITSADEQFFVDNVDLFPGRVGRDPLEPDAPPGYTAGRINFLDSTLFNIAKTELEALDIQLNYTYDAGRVGTFDFYGMATRQFELARRRLPDDPLIDTVGLYDGPLEWRGNAGLNWFRGNWAANWNTQYYDSYFVYTSFNRQFNATATAIRDQGSDTIPRQIYHDLQVRYRIGEDSTFAAGLFANTDVQVGVRNVFDKDPPIVNERTNNQGYSGYADPRLRTYTLSVRKAF